MSVLGGIDPCGSGDRPRTRLHVHILVTLCRFDDIQAPGHIRDHLFLVREGSAKWKSWFF